ncbi:MAG: aminotransferase class I/II-fold pyridoxal phosphate-dependent enzyme [Bacillota bacterium]|nr:aminotransferase class I/II-fold pyridoxal phosphate-dependent enzyme [Bacillota bacterium]
MKTPIYSALQQFIAEDILRLHMPGHAGGRGINNVALSRIAEMDVTEVPGLDDLHLPEGVIKESKVLLADALGAEESFFLVNGASSGLQALCMSLEHRKVLVPRNAHRSMFAGMVLSGLEPVYLPCEINTDLGIVTGVAPDTVQRYLNRISKIKAVFLTSPSYYGTCSDVGQIASITHQKQIPLLVDEAHGGHFPFHPSYPATALQQGADAVVNGLHKTWPVLNQGAVLSVGKGIVDINKVNNAVSLLTTTSPSYLIMASIELARSRLEDEGQYLLEQARILANRYKLKIDQLKGFKCAGDQLQQMDDVTGMDPLKVVVAVDDLGLSGEQVAEVLRTQYKVQVEMSMPRVILAMLSMFHTERDWELFFRALEDISQKYYAPGSSHGRYLDPPYPTVVIPPRQAFFAKKRSCKLAEAVGLVAGEMVAAYPPGIPCLLPGELITGEVLDYLNQLRANDVHIHGPEDASLHYLKVIDEF